MADKTHTIIDVELYALARKQMEARTLAKGAEKEAKELNAQIGASMERYLDLEDGGPKLNVGGEGLDRDIEVNIVQGRSRRLSSEKLLDTGVALQQIEDATVETEYTQVRVRYAP
jgi:hypothetical protein